MTITTSSHLIGLRLRLFQNSAVMPFARLVAVWDLQTDDPSLARHSSMDLSSALEIFFKKPDSVLPVLLDTNSQEYFANLGKASRLFIGNALQVLLEFGWNSERKGRIFFRGH